MMSVLEPVSSLPASPSPLGFLQAERRLAADHASRVDLYAAVHEAAAGLVPTDAFYVCLLDRGAGWLHFVYNCEGDHFDTPEPYPFGDGPTSRVARTGRPVVMVEPEHREGLELHTFADGGTVSGSAVHWPLWIEAAPPEPPDGVLSVQAYASGAYDAAGLAAIEWLALRAADAMRRERVSERADRSCAASALAASRGQAVADVRRFVGILQGLAALKDDPRRLLSEVRRQQVALTQWAPTAPLAEDEVSKALLGLSPRELEVLAHVAQGLSNEAVAGALMCSKHTIKAHLDKIYRQTPLRNRAEVAAAAATIAIARSGDRKTP